MCWVQVNAHFDVLIQRNTLLMHCIIWVKMSLCMYNKMQQKTILKSAKNHVYLTNTYMLCTEYQAPRMITEKADKSLILHGN